MSGGLPARRIQQRAAAGRVLPTHVRASLPINRVRTEQCRRIERLSQGPRSLSFARTTDHTNIVCQEPSTGVYSLSSGTLYPKRVQNPSRGGRCYVYADGHAVEASVQALETDSTLVSLASGPNVIDIEGNKAVASPCHRYRDDPKKSNRLLLSQLSTVPCLLMVLRPCLRRRYRRPHLNSHRLLQRVSQHCRT